MKYSRAHARAQSRSSGWRIVQAWCPSGNRSPASSEAVARLLIPGAFFPDLNIEPLDLLVQRGEGNVEALRRVRLVPVALLQHAHDQAAFAILNDFKK